MINCGKCIILLFSAFLSLFTGQILRASPASDVENIVSMKNLRTPGICVHIGCTDGELEAELAKTGLYAVDGICFDEKNVQTVLNTFLKKEQSGKAAALFSSDKTLPYPPNTINLIIVDDFSAAAKAGITADEMIRILAPYGTLLLKQKIELKGLEKSGAWYRFDKPFPEEMDNWIQSRYDASKTAVSKDKLVGPPNSLRWVAGERWTNEGSWGASEMLAADGRIIFRQGIETGYGFLNRKQGWRLTARDAFNGALLWQRDIYPAKYNRMSFPMLLAEGKVHLQGHLIDAATGKDLEEHSRVGNNYAINVAYQNGYYIQLVGSAGVIDAKTGQQLWQTTDAYVRMSVSDGKTVFQETQIREKDGTKKRILTAKDLKTGKLLWKNDDCQGELFCCKDDLILTSGQKGKQEGYNAGYSAKDGKLLWKYEYDLPGHGGKPYVFFLGGLAWVHIGDNAQKYPKGEAWHGIDPQTGQVTKKVPMEGKVKHRCYPHRATEKYILAGGIDLFDFKEGTVSSFHGIRGGCGTGYVPANGLLYGMPTVCECFAHVRGFPAVSEDVIPSWKEMKKLAGPRFVKGKGSGMPEGNPSPDQWQAYRHDAMLSGVCTASVPAALRQKWETIFTGRISAPVVSGNTVIISQIDSNIISALDTGSGRIRWSFISGGRVGSPPTISGSAVLFGAADGWVYSISLSNGELIWKFRAAPMEKRIYSRSRFESSWPMFGSIPVSDGNVFVSAGRHDEMDGGIFLYCLNAATGTVKWEHQIQRKELLKQVASGQIDNEMNDILRTDGKTVYMYDKSFSAATGEPAEPAGNFLWGGTAGWLDDQTKPPYTWKHDFQRARQIRDKNSRGNLGTIINMEDRTTFVLYSDKSEIFCRQGSSNIEWTYKYKAPQCPRSMAVTKDAVFVPAMQDVDNPSKGEIWVLDKADGILKTTIPLPAAPAFEGIAAVPGMLFVTTEDGRLISFGK